MRLTQLQPVAFEYNGATVHFDRAINSLTDPDNLKYNDNAVVKFVNVGENGDWKGLKVGFPLAWQEQD